MGKVCLTVINAEGIAWGRLGELIVLWSLLQTSQIRKYFINILKLLRLGMFSLANFPKRLAYETRKIFY